AAALQHLTGEPVLEKLSASHRYHPSVFLTPPWPEIYTTDPERRHGFDEAVAEYDRLAAVYPTLGYDIVLLPRFPKEVVEDEIRPVGDRDFRQ
ncbi:AAA family ATPase, partial [Rhizobium ruizarguesonis]